MENHCIIKIGLKPDVCFGITLRKSFNHKLGHNFIPKSHSSDARWFNQMLES